MSDDSFGDKELAKHLDSYLNLSSRPSRIIERSPTPQEIEEEDPSNSYPIEQLIAAEPSARHESFEDEVSSGSVDENVILATPPEVSERPISKTAAETAVGFMIYSDTDPENVATPRQYEKPRQNIVYPNIEYPFGRRYEGSLRFIFSGRENLAPTPAQIEEMNHPELPRGRQVRRLVGPRFRQASNPEGSQRRPDGSQRRHGGSQRRHGGSQRRQTGRLESPQQL